MKIIIEYNLPEENIELKYAIDGYKLSSIIWELDQWLRDLYKHQSKDIIGVEECREKLREIMNEHDITFDCDFFK